MDGLYGSAVRLTRNGADAEDLVAESVAKAWEALPTLRDRQQFVPWMFRILMNAFVSDWRRRRASPVTGSRDGSNEEASSEEFSLFRHLHQPFLLWWGTPEHAFLNKLLRHDLEQAIDGLAEPYRVVLVMVEIHGRSYADTAEALDVPIGTVRSRLARARGLLQRALWNQGKEAGLVAPSAPRPTGGGS